ncbi:ATP-binding cassette domain-containing protein [Streptosporangium sp. NPDC051022]|uniref:ABC transporter ATP-binding protein n=1 Tax=Streptosporangium sp. NPDC051022 TaxID=3155752 RepID=UPI0034126B9E
MRGPTALVFRRALSEPLLLFAAFGAILLATTTLVGLSVYATSMVDAGVRRTLGAIPIGTSGAVVNAPLHADSFATIALAAYVLVAVLVALVTGGADRAGALIHLRALGLSQAQARRLTVLEISPMIVLTAVAGLLLGLALPAVLGPGVDLSSYTGGLAVEAYPADLVTPVLLAAENVGVPMRLTRTPVAEREERVRMLLSLVGLADHADQRPYELSGGQRQRVAIARALANRPRLLIADEPTGQLDSRTGRQIMGLIRAVVRSEGVTALVATHDPALITLADRVLELHDGVLNTAGTPSPV